MGKPEKRVILTLIHLFKSRNQFLHMDNQLQELSYQNDQFIRQIKEMIRENERLVQQLALAESKAEETDKLLQENSILTTKIHELQEREQRLNELNIELEAKQKELEDNLTKALEDAELKSKGTRYKMVTVMFSDVKGFTQLTESQDAEQLIDELDNFFFHFDNVIEKLHVQKIKSIGDSYMCSGGIPKKNRTNPIETVMVALEMQQYMTNLKEIYEQQNKRTWSITTGIHTGPVTAMEIGKKKMQYDIKGDTVNIASRIEAASEPGNVTISAMTYELVSEYFRCEYMGKLPVKYAGGIELYVVKGFRPEYSEDGFGTKPNHKFKVKFALIQYDDLEEFVLDKLEKELPEFLYYHNLKHTIDVTIGVEVIGKGEGITDEELLLLKTAALFHDAGHIIESKNHEYHGTTIVRDILPRYLYTPEQIETICEIIMATKLPPDPKNKLERIICDADLDYLGRRDFIPVSDTLFRELKAQNLVGSLNDWNKLQIKFLTNHQYFTDTANKLREVSKQKQVERIKVLIV